MAFASGLQKLKTWFSSKSLLKKSKLKLFSERNSGAPKVERPELPTTREQRRLRRYLISLEKRRIWLERKLGTLHPDTPSRPYIYQELSALEWALPLLWDIVFPEDEENV